MQYPSVKAKYFQAFFLRTLFDPFPAAPPQLSTNLRIIPKHPFHAQKCRFVNDVLQIWERKKNLFRGTPIKRPHREVIVLALANSELLLEIMKGKELV